MTSIYFSDLGYELRKSEARLIIHRRAFTKTITTKSKFSKQYPIPKFTHLSALNNAPYAELHLYVNLRFRATPQKTKHKRHVYLACLIFHK